MIIATVRNLGMKKGTQMIKENEDYNKIIQKDERERE